MHNLNEANPRYRRMEITGPGVVEDHVRDRQPIVTHSAPKETTIPCAVVVEEYVKGRHPYADDCDLVVMTPVSLKDLASRVAEKLQFAATGATCVLEYAEHGRVCFMVTHA